MGLEPPRGSVHWKTASDEGGLEIGGSVPASHDVIVVASDKPAPAVTSDGFVAELSRPAGEWRSREVVQATRDRIERIAISSAAGSGRKDGAIVLVKSGETLRLENPFVDLTDRELADRLLTDLSALRIDTFLDPPLSTAVENCLAAPVGALELGISGESAPVRIEIGGVQESGKRVWRVGDQAFESSSTLADVVGRKAIDWRSRNWTRFENWRIEKARIEEAAGTFELARSDGEWLRDGQKIPFAEASDLLYALTSAKADSLTEEPSKTTASAPSPPRLTVTLSDADGNEEVLTLQDRGDPAAAEVSARTRGRGVTLHLARNMVEGLEAKIAAVRNAQPVETPTAVGKAAPGGATPAPSSGS